MKYRTKAQLCLGFGIVFTYLLFPCLYDLMAYSIPNIRLKEIYEVGAEDLSSTIVNNPQMFDESGRMFGRIAGFFVGILPLLLGIVLYRKYKKTSKILLEKAGRLPRHPFHFCFGLFCLILALNGVAIIGEDQTGVVTQYSATELIPTSWGEYLAVKDGRIEGGMSYTLDPGIHWVPPFRSFLKFNHVEHVLTEVPIIIPVYIYERDFQGNVIGIEQDDEGANIVLGYYFWTSEGQKFYSTDTWTKIHYRGDYSVDVLKIELKGTYQVVNEDLYASHLVGAYHSKAQWVEEEGYRGEMTDPPSVQQFIEYSLYSVMLEYMLDIKLPALTEIYENPDVLNNPQLITMNIGDTPSFSEFLSNYRLEEGTIGQYFGIAWDSLKVKVFEEEL